MSDKKYLIGIDYGTLSGRAIVVDAVDELLPAQRAAQRGSQGRAQCRAGCRPLRLGPEVVCAQAHASSF